MALDIRTVAFLLFLVSVLLAVMLLTYWKAQKTYAGFNFWTSAAVTMAVGYFLIMLRGEIPDILSIVLANLLIALSILFRVDGINRFFRSRAIPVTAYAVLVPVLIVFCWFTFVQNSIEIRALLSAAVVIPGLAVIIVIALASVNREDRIIDYAFASALAGYIMVYALRSWYWLAVSPPLSIFSDDEFNSLFFTLTLVMDILTVGFFLMLNMVRAQADARASEERYRILSDSLPDYVVVHNGRTLLYANPATTRFTGIPEERLRGMSAMEFIAPEDRDGSNRMAGTVLETSVPTQPHEITIVSPDGRNHTCIVKSVPILYEGESAILSVLTDITERKQMEDALRIANSKLSLLSGITRHDIRNQLMALSTYLQLGFDSAEDPEEVRDYMKKGERIADTIGTQIDIARDYENAGLVSPAWQNIGLLAQEAAESLPMRDIRLEIQCHEFEAFADPLLGKVFYNLIDNSLRYGGEKMTGITIRCETAGPDLHVIVEDNGTGISMNDKSRLFTRGFGRHTGLGLFFIREILAVTNIMIIENGVPGQGARFVLHVPEVAWRRAEGKSPQR